MVKLTYSSDISDSVGVGGEIVKSSSDLKKQASTIFDCEYDALKPPKGKTGIHLVALGALETYGFNRNADGFKSADCKNRCDTFVKHGHVYQHHRNTDPRKAIGEIKAAAYNPDMDRVELYIWADNEKAHDHLERLEKTGETSFSMACVRAGTPILTQRGFKTVERIEPGDMVLTHTGVWKPVKALMSRDVKEYYKVTFVSWGNRSLEITGNHKVLTASFDNLPRAYRKDHIDHPGKRWRRRHRPQLHTVAKWKTVEELTEYDYMCVPLMKSNGNRDGEDIKWARLCGYYIAEGSFTGPKPSNLSTMFTCNVNDCFVREIETLANWKSVSYKSQANSEKVVRIYCYGKSTTDRLLKSCGRRCENKMIPPEIRNGTYEEKFNFAAAWFNGDGWQDKTGLHWSIHPQNLAIDLQVLLASINIPSSCTFIMHPFDRGAVKSANAGEYVVSVSNEYSSLFSDISKATDVQISGASKTRTFISGNYLMVPVDEVYKIDTPTKVYNFSVADDESYTVYGLIAHNCSVPGDYCSRCNAYRKGPDDPNECDHIKYELGKIAEDGKFTGMINKDPTWFDISFVGRPADRIAWSLKTASGLMDSVKAAEYEGVVLPDDIAIESKEGLRKQALVKDLASGYSNMVGWLKSASCKTHDEKYLFEMRKLASLRVPDGILSTLRAYSPRDTFEALADAGVVLDARSFFKYAMGQEYATVEPYVTEVEKAAGFILKQAAEGSCAALCNSTEFDPYPSDDFRRKPLPGVLVAKLAEYGTDNPDSKILDVTLSGETPRFRIDESCEKGVSSSVSTKLAEKYVAYKLAAIDAVLNSRYGVNRNKNHLAAISAAQDLKQGE